MFRALIVDDEPNARDELEQLLVDTGAFKVAGKCGDPVQAVALARAERPDVLFLDIEMPGVTGLELLGMLDEDVKPEVVFVTAHEVFAVQAFEKSALDYLLKPVEPARLAKTVDKLRSRRSTGALPSYQAPPVTRIPCLAARAIKLVPVAEVEFVKTSEAGVYVVTPAGEFYTELTLATLEARAGLLRCHKQFLVNIDRIDEISLSENSLAVIRTKSGLSVPVSRRHLAKLRAALGL